MENKLACGYLESFYIHVDIAVEMGWDELFADYLPMIAHLICKKANCCLSNAIHMQSCIFII